MTLRVCIEEIQMLYAKIYNNGTTVIFGDLKVVLDRSKYNQ